MQDINHLILIGRIGQDIELKYTANNKELANFSIASNQYNDKISWFDCVAWGNTAEVMHKYCKKGSRIAVEGRIEQQTWEDTQGNKRSKIQVVANNVQFLDKKNEVGQENVQEEIF